ncbi:hypothetical protein N0V87_005407 [Didymella glomerata]|uniref:Uncharacterized protein n=1 Tax=Didymella glomerata TaxID=749621 RepID=A0A9W8WZF2_9PLEO|nr:hypothetical protein N0V87_005407 [Didymella glomerata]
MARAAEASELPAHASGRCGSEDTSRDQPASSAASQTSVADETATLSMATPAPAQWNSPSSTTAITELEDTLVMKKMVIGYPPTPAMSVSELQSTSEEMHSNPSPTTELKATETFNCDFEARSASTRLSARAMSHYCPPPVTDQSESDDKEHSVSPPSVPTLPSFCAADGQIILRPPEDFCRTYIVEEVTDGLRLPQQNSQQQNSQASERAQTTVASLPRMLNTKSAPTSLSIWPDTPPASPRTDSQGYDLTFIMAALASYPLPPQLPTHDLKRPFITGVDVDTLEEHPAKRQKLSEPEVVVEDVPDTLDSMRNEETVVSDIEKDAKQDTSDSETQAISPMQDRTPDAVTNNFSKGPAHLAVEELRPSHRGDVGRLVGSATPAEQLAGAYAQSPDMEMEERVSTMSRSPTLVSSVLPPVSSRYTEMTFKSLKPPVDPTAPTKSEADDHEEHLSDAEEEEQQVESDSHESDELSEADDEEISLLAAEVETGPEDIQGTTPPIKESTPAPLAEDVDESGSRETRTALIADDAIAHQVANAAHAVKLHHEAEFHYERRATRSETRTSDCSDSTLSVENESDTASGPPIKGEEQPAPNKAKQGKTAHSRTSQPRSTPTDAPKTKTAVARVKPTPKPVAVNKAGPTSTPKPPGKAKPPAQRTTAVAIKPKPKPKTSVLPKSKTPSPAEAPSSTTKSRKGTPKINPATEVVLGKRKTRRSSALEEESKKAAEAENNIAKRLRSKGTE